MSRHGNPTFDSARDELFSQIHRCGVMKASPEQQREWLRDTVAYLHEIHPGLSDAELNELREVGERFCQPPIPHGKGRTELTRDEWEGAPPEMEAEAPTDVPTDGTVTPS
jgi:hypothetical protein